MCWVLGVWELQKFQRIFFYFLWYGNCQAQCVVDHFYCLFKIKVETKCNFSLLSLHRIHSSGLFQPSCSWVSWDQSCQVHSLVYSWQIQRYACILRYCWQLSSIDMVHLSTWPIKMKEIFCWFWQALNSRVDFAQPCFIELAENILRHYLKLSKNLEEVGRGNCSLEDDFIQFVTHGRGSNLWDIVHILIISTGHYISMIQCKNTY